VNPPIAKVLQHRPATPLTLQNYMSGCPISSSADSLCCSWTINTPLTFIDRPLDHTYVGTIGWEARDKTTSTPSSRSYTSEKMMDGIAISKQYPQAGALEEALKHVAIGLGDPTAKPFRVDMIRVHGGKPPVYCIVIRSFAKEPLRQKLEQLLNRRLTCGSSSFMLKADEAERIVAGTRQ
jgi:hypothetical protein